MMQANTVVPPAAPAVGWWESIKQHVNNLLNRLNWSVADVMQMAIFFGIGFFGGFFLRRYARSLLILVITVVLLFVLFDYWGFMAINWTRVQELTGINPQCTLSQCWHGVVGYLRAHVMVSVSALIGFLIGYGVG